MDVCGGSSVSSVNQRSFWVLENCEVDESHVRRPHSEANIQGSSIELGRIIHSGKLELVGQKEKYLCVERVKFSSKV